MITSKLTMVLCGVVAAAIVFAVAPGSRTVAPDKSDAISIDAWERIAFEHQDTSYARELLGQPVRHPELLRTLEAEGISPESFRKTGESALKLHLERIAAEESTFEFVAERPTGGQIVVILDRDGFSDEATDGFGSLIRRLQAGVARQYLESNQ